VNLNFSKHRFTIELPPCAMVFKLGIASTHPKLVGSLLLVSIPMLGGS
jgi:hypothetical protein